MNRTVVRAYARKLGRERGTKVGLADAEAEILRVIQKAARLLSSSNTFGYYSREDITQQGILEGLEAIEDGHYDPERPLENFMHVHIKNRLSNIKRKEWMRVESPCDCCDAFNPPEEPCLRWKQWFTRNTNKQNLMRPIDVDSVPEHNMTASNDVLEEVELNELLALIDTQLPLELRSDYLKLRAGVSVPKDRKQRVREAITEILYAH
jgi:hypothetical protein